MSGDAACFFAGLLVLLLCLFETSLACMTNYQFFDFDSSLCLPCPVECLNCFDSTLCTGCISQYYYVDSTNQCLSCGFGCKVCESEDKCIECQQGLYINGQGECLACSLGVRSCTIAMVESCKPGYFLLGGICVGCFSNCETCQDFVTCTKCLNGFFLSNTSTLCLACSSNCLVCQDSTTCTFCSAGYTLDNGLCTIANCSSASLFCTKCNGNTCEQCEFGKYLQNGACVQGASLLCLTAVGPSHTQCETNLYGCPYYAAAQTDISDGSLLPICLPLKTTQTEQYVYTQNTITACSLASGAGCSAGHSQTASFSTLKAYYKLEYTISVRVYSSAVQQLTVSYMNSSNGVVASRVHSLNLNREFSQNVIDAQCFNCNYGQTIINGELGVAGGQNDTLLQISTSSGFHQVIEILIKTSICKIERCISCTTAIDCTQCASPYFLQLISCVLACDPGFYTHDRSCVLTCPLETYPIQSSYECAACVSPCRTCSSANSCLSCVSGYFLDGSTCVTACTSLQMFTNLTSGNCEKCPNPCTQCSLQIVNVSLWLVRCDGCRVGYLLQNEGTCTYLCPAGSFASFLNNRTQCSGCQVGCSECSIRSNICLGCDSPFLLYSSSCLANFSCPAGYYIDSSKNSCQKCSFPCSACSDTPTNCTGCLKGALFNNTCPMTCPPGMFISYAVNEQVCATCQADCTTCQSLTVCQSCMNGKYLYQGACVSACPTDLFYEQTSNNTCTPCIAPCLTCTSQTACLSCTTGFIDLSTNRCTLQCDQSAYPDSNFVCQSCTSPCLRCRSASSCSMCSLPFVLQNESCITSAQCEALNRYVHSYLNYSSPTPIALAYQCLPCTFPCQSCNNSAVVCLTCAPGYLLVTELSTCVTECPQSYYNSTVTTCSRCDGNCLACEISATRCIGCGTGMFLDSVAHVCIMSCPAQYYGSNEQQACKPCQPPCKECFNLFLCQSCLTGILYNKGCVAVCPAGSLEDTSTNSCMPCTNNCLSCSLLPSNCTECPTNGFYNYQFQCLTACPALFYADDLTHSCEACMSPCRECLSSAVCSTCVVGYYLLENEGVGLGDCLVECPLGYYHDNITGVCGACNRTICRTCQDDPNSCLLCASGYYFDFNSSACVSACPSSTYADPFFLECRTCTFPCSVCSSADICLQCQTSYMLFQSNCYSGCPRGYYPDASSSCQPCPSICEICTSTSVCQKCTDGYFADSLGACVRDCGLGLYGGSDVMTNYPVCVPCISHCLSCLNGYTCLQCNSSYFLFNGLCADECPDLYFQLSSPTSPSCEACPLYCNKCLNSSFCQECLNAYMYRQQCYQTCPSLTYTFNQQSCLDCQSPCLECSSQFTCLSCRLGYFYFQNYCVEKCPEDVWKYPQTGSCSAECTGNKYVQKMECYISGCGGMLVQLNGLCLVGCPQGYYVDRGQNCVECGSSGVCSSLFVGEMAVLRSYNLRVSVYFSQLIDPAQLDTSKIVTKFYDKNNQQSVMLYSPSSIQVDQSKILIEFGYQQISLYTLQVTIPYVPSTQSEQSISYNTFKQQIYTYENYQFEAAFVKTSSTDSTTASSESSSSYDQLFAPSQAINNLAYVVAGGCFLMLAINVVCKGTHFRQLLDFLQFVAATLYLEIQYPPVLEQYLRNARISLFSFFPQVANFQPFSFSPSKFIEYQQDASLLRSQGLTFIIFIALLMVFGIVIAVNKFYPDRLEAPVARIKYRNLTDIFSVFCLPLLIYSFRFGTSQPVDILASVLVIALTLGFLLLVSYILMTAKTLQEIAGLAGELEHTQGKLGHMYTPFAFIRKLIFGLVVCIQPYKPISTLVLLLIFTILIMVCLFFYQPFDNQTTDYICIGMEIVLVLYVLLITLFGLNVVQGAASHYVGLVAVIITLVGGLVGLGWLVYLTYGAMDKFIREVKTGKEEVMDENKQNNDNMFRVPGIVERESEVVKVKNHLSENNQPIEQDSANQLLREPQLMGRKEEYSDNGEEFRHWNNSESEEKRSEEGKQNRPPKYLLKMDRVGNEE